MRNKDYKSNTFRITMSNGEVFPDPNLLNNIESLIDFIEITIFNWESHVEQVNRNIKGLGEHEKAIVLFEKRHVNIYTKTLFDICTYYISCYEAIKQLDYQLNQINKTTRAKKEKDEFDYVLYEKVLYLRDRSFIHQNSTKEKNLANKRIAMNWTPTMSGKIGEPISCNSYKFGILKSWIKINDEKIVHDKDFEIHDLNSFAQDMKSQLQSKFERSIAFYINIKKKSELAVNTEYKDIHKYLTNSKNIRTSINT
ncbi:hypothetical protein ACH42_06365 [Endozoicomonas sp. (ex Bugula neritina AB1)]|nr:hypothetical protein ACH42_06365 [Endozoicomonas sp. (ex Bugula neritina AB1)]